MASGAKNPTSAGECSRRSYFVIRSKKLVLDGLLVRLAGSRTPPRSRRSSRHEGSRRHGHPRAPPGRGGGARARAPGCSESLTVEEAPALAPL